MKKILLLACMSIFTLSGCKKQLNVYNDAVNHSINTQAIALKTIFTLVNMQHKTAIYSGVGTANNCTTHTADTISGTVYDATVVYAGSCLESDRYSAGTFTSNYPLNYPGLLQEVHLQLNNLVSNGKTFSGEIIFFHSALNTIKISSLNLTASDFRGTTNLTIDLEMKKNFNNAITGEIKGSGANIFQWKTLSQIYGTNNLEYLGPQQAVFLFGEASFISNGLSLNENYGNGEDDNLSVFSDKEDERKFLKLPKF